MPGLAFLALLLSFITAAAAPLHAQATSTGQSPVISTDTVHSQLTSSLNTITPGGEFDLAWELHLDPHWHVYWSNPGDSGIAPSLKIPGFTVAKPVFPVPHIISVPPITNYGYEDHLILTVHATAPKDLPTGPLALPVKLTYLYCADVCMPGQVSVTLPLTVAAQPVINPAFAPLRQAQAAALPKTMPADANLKAILNQKTQTISFSFNPQAFGGPLKDIHVIPAADGWLHDSAPQPLTGNTLTLALDPYQTKSVSAVDGLLLVNGVGYTLSTPLLSPTGTPATASAANSLPDAPATTQTAPPHQSTATAGQTTPPAAPLMSAVMPPATPPSPVTTATLTLPLALFFAVLAGLILNVMPCVLPVLSFKLLSLVRQRSAASRRRHALFYTFGVLLGFWAFAGVILLVQQSGQSLGWGFHLQNPLFVAALVALMLVIALNLFGVFEAGAHLTRLTGKPTSTPANTFLNDLGVGLLAVIVATPCTVPFMGGAVAYALAQPPLLSLLVFTALGFGMALPFLLIGLVPALISWLPKPGAWMLTLKHFFGWPMLATALWLLWVFANQTSFTATFMLLICLLGLAFALWLYGHFPRILTLVLTFIPLALGAWLLPPLITMTTPGSPAGARADAMWQPWSADALATARQNNQPVFVDFTADWCLTCKVTEATVLDTTRVQAFFKQKNILLLQGDWTRQDAAITAELAAHGRRGVPLYLAYLPGHAQPITFPQLLTPGLIEQTFTNR